MWILPGFFDASWWVIDEPQHGCTPSEILTAVEGTLYFSRSFKYPYEVIGISGQTAGQVYAEYELRSSGKKLFGSHVISLAYDAVWLLAMMFNQSQQIFQEKGSSFACINVLMARVIFDKATC